MQNFAFLERTSAVNVLTRCQIFLPKSTDAINDSINIFRDNLEQNKIFKKFIRGRINTFAASYEYTRSNPLNLLYIQKTKNLGICRRFRGLGVSAFDFTLNFRSNLASLPLQKTCRLRRHAFNKLKISVFFDAKFCIFEKSHGSERVNKVSNFFSKILSCYK